MTARAPIEAAEAAYLSGDLEYAERLCRSMLEDGVLTAEASHLLGAISMKRGDPGLAVQWFERGIENGLKTSMAFTNCGEAYRQLNRWDEAYSWLEQALRLDNANPNAHFTLGRVMRSMGHAKESEHFFRTALMLRPGMARAHNELGELYRQEGHFLEAKREYVNALALVEGNDDSASHGRHLQWNIRLASLLRESGQPFQAIEILERIAGQQEQAAAHYEMAITKFELSWEDAANEHYLIAARCQPSLVLHNPPRVRSARLTAVKEGCEAGAGQYTILASSHFLNMPRLRVIPAAASEEFSVGAPIAPELGCAEVSNAEILPGDFSTLVQGRLFVGGVVNWFQHFAQRARFIRHEADDGRVLLDLPPKVQEYDGACVLLGKGNDQYAWLYEALARLWVVEQLPKLKELPMVISDDIPADRLAMLCSFGVSEERLLRLGGDCTLLAREVHIPTLPTIGDWISPLALQFLRRRLRGLALPAIRRIYLSREGLPDRRLENEAELRGLLEGHGFELIKVRDKTSMELISILREASVVVGIDDDALANLVVCPQGAQLGIITSAGFNRPRAHFICGQLAQKLTYLVGQANYESNPAHALCDILLPKVTLQAFLGQLGPAARQAKTL